jgi:hypothetical protein
MGKAHLVQCAIGLDHSSGNPCATLTWTPCTGTGADDLRKCRIQPYFEAPLA